MDLSFGELSEIVDSMDAHEPQLPRIRHSMAERLLSPVEDQDAELKPEFMDILFEGDEEPSDKDGLLEELGETRAAEDIDPQDTKDPSAEEAFYKVNMRAHSPAIAEISKLPALDMKTFARRPSVASGNRMSVADMKGALAHFSNNPAAAAKKNKTLTMPPTLTSRTQCFHFISAMFLLQSRHRRIQVTSMAHYFTVWRQTVGTITDDAGIVDGSDEEEEEAAVPPAPPSEPGTPLTSRAEETFWKDTWSDVASPGSALRLTQAKPGAGAGARADAGEDLPRTPPRSPKSPTRQAATAESLKSHSLVSAESGCFKQQRENAALKSKLVYIRSRLGDAKDLSKFKIISARHTMRVWIKQSFRRKLENAFHTWTWMCRAAKDVKMQRHRSMLLVQEQQQLHAKEFKIKSLMHHNSELNNAIQCSHAFFRWKIWSIHETYSIESRRAEEHRKKIYDSLRDLKAALLKQIHESKQGLSVRLAAGHDFQDSLVRVQTSVAEAASLTASINDSCEGGSQVVLVLPSVAAKKTRWAAVRDVLGVDKEAAAKLDKVLSKLKVKQVSTEPSKDEVGRR